MIQLTHIYKTERAGDRKNQTELIIGKNDPKFFFTLVSEKPLTFKAEICISGKTCYHLFDVHEHQTDRGIDYAFPLPKLPAGEYDVLFTLSVRKLPVERRMLKLIVR